MKVDVNRHVRPRKKVDITLVRSRGTGSLAVKLPVRPVNSSRADDFDERVRYLSREIDAEHRKLLSDDEAGLSWVTEEIAGDDSCEAMDEFEFDAPQYEDEPTEPEKTTGHAAEQSPDEDELLALIADEEAEMAAARDEAELRARRSDEERADATVRLADQPEDGSIDTETAQAAHSEAFAQDEPDDAPANLTDPHFMRYFDRGANGEKIEVERSQATGQEIICRDSESGKISRICGVIKNDASQLGADTDED